MIENRILRDPLARADHPVDLPPGVADDGLDSGEEQAIVERPDEVVVGAESQGPDPGRHVAHARKDEYGCLDAGRAQAMHKRTAIDIGQDQLQQDRIVVVEFTKLDRDFTETGIALCNGSDAYRVPEWPHGVPRSTRWSRGMEAHGDIYLRLF